jgi:hypothetical protein
MGAPYALSSDLVSAWPAKSLEVAQYIDEELPLIAMTQNAQTGTTYTFVAADFTKLVTFSNASPVAVTLPLEATVPWPAGTQLRLLNKGAGLVTVAGAVGVTIYGSPLSLAQNVAGTLIKTATNTWYFLPSASAPSSDSATVATSQTTTSTSYTDLATVGPAVTLSTGTKAFVICYTEQRNASTQSVYSSFAVSGATTIAASDTFAFQINQSVSNYVYNGSIGKIVTGLTAGSNTFTAKYRVTGSTGTFVNRVISVIDLGS